MQTKLDSLRQAMTQAIATVEHKTMNTIVHAAVRRDLGRFDQALAVFPANSQPRANELKRAWDNFEEEIHHHHTYEETLFWPRRISSLRGGFFALGAGEAGCWEGLDGVLV